MADASIVRNRAKIEASINNARVAADLDDEPGRAAVVVRARRRPAARPAAMADLAGRHRRIDGDGQGTQAAGIQVLRADDGLCADAGDGHGRRPRRGLLAGRR